MAERPAPSAKPLAEKLGIKPGHRVLVLNAGGTPGLGLLPDGARLVAAGESGVDLVLAFVHNRPEVEAICHTVTTAVRRDGLLWFAYPKKTSSMKSDISRDSGWEPLLAEGWEGIAMVAVDGQWSAMRFRPSELVKNSRSRP